MPKTEDAAHLGVEDAQVLASLDDNMQRYGGHAQRAAAQRCCEPQKPRSMPAACSLPGAWSCHFANDTPTVDVQSALEQLKHRQPELCLMSNRRSKRR